MLCASTLPSKVRHSLQTLRRAHDARLAAAADSPTSVRRSRTSTPRSTSPPRPLSARSTRSSDPSVRGCSRFLVVDSCVLTVSLTAPAARVIAVPTRLSITCCTSFDPIAPRTTPSSALQTRSTSPSSRLRASSRHRSRPATRSASRPTSSSRSSGSCRNRKRPAVPSRRSAEVPRAVAVAVVRRADGAGSPVACREAADAAGSVRALPGVVAASAAVDRGVLLADVAVAATKRQSLPRKPAAVARATVAHRVPLPSPFFAGPLVLFVALFRPFLSLLLVRVGVRLLPPLAPQAGIPYFWAASTFCVSCTQPCICTSIRALHMLCLSISG